MRRDGLAAAASVEADDAVSGRARLPAQCLRVRCLASRRRASSLRTSPLCVQREDGREATEPLAGESEALATAGSWLAVLPGMAASGQ